MYGASGEALTQSHFGLLSDGATPSHDASGVELASPAHT